MAQRKVTMDANEANNLKDRYAEGGITQAELARIHNVSERTIWNILHGKTHNY